MTKLTSAAIRLSCVLGAVCLTLAPWRVAATDPPGTNLVLIPLGSYSNSVPFYLPNGTNAPTMTNNPLGWEAFSAVNNGFLWASNRLRPILLTNVLALAPITVTNATNTTWSRGGGFIVCGHQLRVCVHGDEPVEAGRADELVAGDLRGGCRGCAVSLRGCCRGEAD